MDEYKEYDKALLLSFCCTAFNLAQFKFNSNSILKKEAMTKP